MFYINPMAYWAPAIQLGFIAFEAQSVIAMRCFGMAGIWSVTPSENNRMISEKAHALTRSSTDATIAMMQGRPADKVLSAAIKPLRQKTRANARRLGKRGFKTP